MKHRLIFPLMICVFLICMFSFTATAHSGETGHHPEGGSHICENNHHDLIEHESLKPTCTTDGHNRYKTCKNCDYTTLYGNGIPGTSNVIPATGHTQMTVHSKSATCTQAGWQTYTVCSVCNEMLTPKIVIPAKQHTVSVTKGYAPTCTQNGLTDGSYCRECNTVFDTQTVIPATGHTAVKDKKIEATCLNSGKTQGSHCSVCGFVITMQQIIPPAGHRMKTVPGIEATCTSYGMTDGEMCEICGEITRTQAVITPRGHSFSEENDICVFCGIKNTEQTKPTKDCFTVHGNFAYMPCNTTVGQILSAGHLIEAGNGVLISDKTAVSTNMRLTVNGTVLTTVIPGDVDCNGAVNVADARLTLRQAIGLEDFTGDSAQFKAADTDCDGSVTVGEARKILRCAIALDSLTDLFSTTTTEGQT